MIQRNEQQDWHLASIFQLIWRFNNIEVSFIWPIIIMDKEQSRLKVLSEIRKERVATYPYYIVANTYSAQDHHFIVAADYRAQTAELSIYPFKSDMTRLTTSTLLLTDILPRKIIATIHVSSIVFKANISSVIISQAEFILGYRTGHLVVVQYKDRDFKVKQRFNRGLKGEGFFSRASSAIFGGEQTYTPYFKAPIRSFRLHPFTPDLYHGWQVGNNIILQRELNQDRENRFFAKHQSMDFDNFYLNYDINTVIKEGEYHCYGCDYYSALENSEYRMALVAFRDQVNSYVNLPQRKELIVGLASKEEILVLDHSHFVLKGVIKLQIPLRNLSNFNSEGQDFLILMPYENYIIVYNLATNTYCKLKGHKSFVANATFSSKDSKLISAGMDHRICFMSIKNISATNWIPMVQQSSKTRKIKEFEVPQQKFEDIYHIGEYNNNRSNLSSYGYGCLFELNGYYCLSTYDGKIIVHAL